VDLGRQANTALKTQPNGSATLNESRVKRTTLFLSEVPQVHDGNHHLTWVS
jgi:hypothetical protein